MQPMEFHKRKASGYSPDEYFTAILHSEADNQDAGMIHRATLKVPMANAETITYSDAFIKLASTPEQRAKLDHEFSVYQTLAAANVNGIPHVLGMFEEIDGGPMVFITTNGGNSLAVKERPWNGINGLPLVALPEQYGPFALDLCRARLNV